MIASIASNTYSLYGLHVRSEVPLPVQTTRDAGDGDATTWTFRFATSSVAADFRGPGIADIRCLHGRVCATRYSAIDGDWLCNPSIVTFHVSPETRRVEIHPEADGEEQLIGLLLIGQVSIFILHLLRTPTLHASAIRTGRGVVAFLGPPAQGKSTVASTFLKRGAALVSDDCLPIRADVDGIYGGPSLPIMKVWNQTATHALSIHHELPALLPYLDKRLLAVHGRYPFVDKAVRLSALYRLEPYEPAESSSANVAVRQLSARESLATLLGQTVQGGLLRQNEVARLLPIYAQLVTQAPLRVLRFPIGFGYQDLVYDRVMADLEHTG